MHPERLLLGPGPSNPYPEVMEAFQRPVLGHLDPDFLVVLDEIGDDLRAVFRTNNELTLPISGTGSAGMEACFVNLVEPGDTAIIGVNGVFGERMCEVARRCGADVVRVEQPWGRAIDPQQLLDAQPRQPARAARRRGTRRDVDRRRERHRAARRLATDRHVCSSSTASRRWAAYPVDVDAWGVDAVYSGTQKCLGVPPGLSPLSFSARAVERVRARTRPAQSWYLDLALLADYVGTARRYHHTAPISMLYALHAGLGALLEEGLDAAHARHRHVGSLLRDALPELGFRPFAQEQPLPQLTSVWLPEGVDDAKIRGELRTRYDIEVGGGLGALAGKGWRIGLMGHSARERSVVALLGALGALLVAAVVSEAGGTNNCSR